MVVVSGRPGFTVRNVVARAKGGVGQVCTRFRGLQLCLEGHRSPHASSFSHRLAVQGPGPETVMGKIRLADHVTQGEGPAGMNEGPMKTPTHCFRRRVGIG